MAYILRFTQEYQPAHHRAVLELEAQFKELERRQPDFPQGRRYQPLASGEATHSLIWESEFASLADLQKALEKIETHPKHTELLAKQSPFFTTMRTEIFKTLDL
jgi:hypothetical protein